MAANAQLRIYKVKPGRLDDFVRVFTEQVLPVRAQYGFRCLGAWTQRDEPDLFTWVVQYDGDLDWDEADRIYYESPERGAISPKPGEYLEGHVQTPVLVPVPLER